MTAIPVTATRLQRACSPMYGAETVGGGTMTAMPKSDQSTR